jgi:hypothetical protein
MPVVVSDFEVIVEPPPNDESAARADEGKPDGVLKPHEVELLLERQEERAARVRAH